MAKTPVIKIYSVFLLKRISAGGRKMSSAPMKNNFREKSQKEK
jgi:hypothetical protein